MTVSEMMTKYGFTPSPTYEGIQNANDMVLAIDFSGTATDFKEFLVAEKGITEHSGTIEPTEEETEYLRTGKNNNRTGATRKIEIKGDVHCGDAFQDKLLDFKTKYGTGNGVIFDYIYYSVLTGKGEKGKGTLSVTEDNGGVAGGKTTLAATFVCGRPEEFTYTTGG